MHTSIFRKNIRDIKSGEESNLKSIIQLITSNKELTSIQFDFSISKYSLNEEKLVSVGITDVTDQLITKQVNTFSFEIMREALDPSKTINEISNLFIDKYENLFPNTYCSILLISDNHFEHLSSPSLPSNFFDGLPNLPNDSFLKLVNFLNHSNEILFSDNLETQNSWSFIRNSIIDFDIKSCTQYPILNNKGEPVALFNVFRKDNFKPTQKDTDASKHLLELISLIFEMIRHKNKHKSLLKSIQDGFFSINNSYEIIYWNDMAEELTSIKRNEAIGSNFLNIFKFSDTNYLNQITTIIDSRKHKTLEAFIPKISKWIEMIFYPNESKSWSVFFRDISDRHQKEQYIIETNERLEKILNAVNDAVYEMNLEDELIHWSNGYNEIFGYLVKNNIINSKEFFKLIHGKDRQMVKRLYNEALNDKNQDSLKLEYSYRRKDGSFAHVVDRANIIRNKEGKAEKIIGAVTDISMRKEYEESLELMNSQLQKRAEELKESNLELEQFAYLASHDLQEPLRTITSFISKIDRNLSDQIDEKTKSYLNFVTEGASRMRQLITDLLKYSQLGKSPLEMENISMENIIKSVKHALQKEIEDNNAEIIYENLPFIISSNTQLFQIFSNLISNSLKYRKKDLEPVIQITHLETSNENIFIVTDNGVGIPIKFQEKVFEIFKRLHVSPEYSGTGIGLAIVKKATEALKGRIILSSSTEGISVKIVLPKHVI
jgi:PAS domain S-box-containing protein